LTGERHWRGDDRRGVGSCSVYRWTSLTRQYEQADGMVSEPCLLYTSDAADE